MCNATPVLEFSDGAVYVVFTASLGNGTVAPSCFLVLGFIYSFSIHMWERRAVLVAIVATVATVATVAIVALR